MSCSISCCPKPLNFACADPGYAYEIWQPSTVYSVGDLFSAPSIGASGLCNYRVTSGFTSSAAWANDAILNPLPFVEVLCGVSQRPSGVVGPGRGYARRYLVSVQSPEGGWTLTYDVTPHGQELIWDYGTWISDTFNATCGDGYSLTLSLSGDNATISLSQDAPHLSCDDCSATYTSAGVFRPLDVTVFQLTSNPSNCSLPSLLCVYPINDVLPCGDLGITEYLAFKETGWTAAGGGAPCNPTLVGILNGYFPTYQWLLKRFVPYTGSGCQWYTVPYLGLDSGKTTPTDGGDFLNSADWIYVSTDGSGYESWIGLLAGFNIRLLHPTLGPYRVTFEMNCLTISWNPSLGMPTSPGASQCYVTHRAVYEKNISISTPFPYFDDDPMSVTPLTSGGNFSVAPSSVDIYRA